MELNHLTDTEYEFWQERAKREYKLENIRANGLTEKEAEEKANADFLRYLPDGLGSIDQHVYTIKDNNTAIKLYQSLDYQTTNLVMEKELK